ncbi:MAG TPA: OsmC family protein [Thermoplasmata archaeon]|nr:OsmC family protein [Thermoplasmata archaeon]
MEKFSSKLSSDMTWPAKLETQNGLTIEFSKPPEFRGMKGTLTPEDAFVSSVITCLACTFDSYANRMRLKILRYESVGTGTVDTVDGVQKFTQLEVRIKITIPAEIGEESVQKAIDKAKGNCLVTASLNTPVTYDIQIVKG